MDLESLRLLETKIGQFVEQHERAHEEHESLRQRLRDTEKQLAEVTSQLKRYEHERAEVRVRIERILSRLEGLDLT